MIASLPHSLSRRILSRSTRWVAGQIATRSMGVACKPPSLDPLHLLQQECISRQLCDTNGNRLPGVDWRFAIGVSDVERPGAVRRRDRNRLLCGARV